MSISFLVLQGPYLFFFEKNAWSFVYQTIIKQEASLTNTKKLFGTNGIRGIANVEITPEIAARVGSAIGTFFGRKDLLIGHDARTTGPLFADAVISGLTATGCNVYFAGMAPTPALQLAVRKHSIDGAVIITASHNPPQYNGIKVIWCDGVETSHEQEEQIEQIYFGNKIVLADWDKVGKKIELPGVIEGYVHDIQTHINVGKISRQHYHVVVDAANSVGGLTAPTLLRELGCKVTSINANIDGTFPGRPPEPRPEDLSDIANTVKAIGADMGVAFDGDADRSIFVDENGQVYWGDKTFAIIAKYFLLNNPGATIVTPISSSSLVKETVETYRGKLVWTKVGAVTVSHKMKELNAKLGGEENGGVFFGPHQRVRDGTMTTALVLNIMASTGKRLSELVAEQPQYFLEKSKVECPNDKKADLQKEVLKSVKEKNTSTIDGVKIWFEDKSAILIRPSGTEPIFRLYAEAKTSDKAAKLVTNYTALLNNLLAKL